MLNDEDNDKNSDASSLTLDNQKVSLFLVFKIKIKEKNDILYLVLSAWK